VADPLKTCYGIVLCYTRYAMNKDVIELTLAIALLCVLGGIAFAIWSVAVAITSHANVASMPYKVVLANENNFSAKLEVELSGNHIWPLKIDLGNPNLPLKVELSNDHALDVRLEPVELFHVAGDMKVQLDPVVILEGKLQVELENGIRPLEVKAVGSRD
jgi:hypothetical protein